MNTDFVCIGNHEFDYGAERLEELMLDSKLTWLGGNIKHANDGTLIKGAKSTSVRMFKDKDTGEEMKVGILGVCTQLTPQLSHPGM